MRKLKKIFFFVVVIILFLPSCLKTEYQEASETILNQQNKEFIDAPTYGYNASICSCSRCGGNGIYCWWGTCGNCLCAGPTKGCYCLAQCHLSANACEELANVLIISHDIDVDFVNKHYEEILTLHNNGIVKHPAEIIHQLIP